MDRACRLADRLNAFRSAVAVAENWSASSASRAGAQADLLINATALGMASGDALPFGVQGLQPHAIVADIVTKDNSLVHRFNVNRHTGWYARDGG